MRLRAFGTLVASNPFALAILLVLVLLGGIMFFLPLDSIRKKMLAEKQRERKNLVQRLGQLSNCPFGCHDRKSSTFVVSGKVQGD